METDIQKAIYLALKNNAALDALLARHHEFGGPGIYGYFPQSADSGDNSLYPFITLGEDNIRDWSTDTASGGEDTVAIHIWSRANGWGGAKNIAGAVYKVLHRAELTLDNHEFIGLDFEASEAIRDPDGETLHMVATYIMILDEAGYGE